MFQSSNASNTFDSLVCQEKNLGGTLKTSGGSDLVALSTPDYTGTGCSREYFPFVSPNKNIGAIESGCLVPGYSVPCSGCSYWYSCQQEGKSLVGCKKPPADFVSHPDRDDSLSTEKIIDVTGGEEPVFFCRIFDKDKIKFSAYQLDEQRGGNGQDRCGYSNNYSRWSGHNRRNFDSRRCAIRDSQNTEELQAGWIELMCRIDNMVDFDWYATLTFREPVHPESADKRYRRWLHKINREVLGVRYWKRSKGVFWVRALEWQKRGVLHFHCLIAGVKGLRRLSYMDKWNELAGYARIWKYDKNLGAKYYLGKYLTKKGEFDIGGQFPVAMQ